MECGICFDYFDSTRHRPKVLPCGHSYCLACLQGLGSRRCPECRRGFTTAAEGLLDNLNLLTLSETTGSDPRLRLWCCDCKSVAKPDCRATHTLRSTKAVLKDEVVHLHMQAVQLAEGLLEPLRVDDDGAREQALHVLELARQPGTTLEVSVRGQSGEAFTATWTSPHSPPSAPAGQHGTAEAVEAVTTNVLILALAKKGLWKRGEQGRDGARGQGEAQGGAAPDLLVLDELEVENNPAPKRKDELLLTVREHRVRRLADLSCYEDPAWSLQLLQLAAPHVEALQVLNIRREHLQAVLAMPRLRQLHVHALTTGQSDHPAKLPPLPAHHVGLRWLCVDWLPRETTFSLIRRHAGTLEELWLQVGTPGGVGCRWLYVCDDLHAALGRCGLARLRRLVLRRSGDHKEKPCRAQLSAVRRALPGVQVQCRSCDNVAFHF